MIFGSNSYGSIEYSGAKKAGPSIIQKLVQFIVRRLSGKPAMKLANGIQTQTVYNPIRIVKVTVGNE